MSSHCRDTVETLSKHEDATSPTHTFVGTQAASLGPDNHHPVHRPRTGTANDEKHLSCFCAHTQQQVEVKGSRGALGQGERADSQSIKLPHLMGQKLMGPNPGLLIDVLADKVGEAQVTDEVSKTVLSFGTPWKRLS